MVVESKQNSRWRLSDTFEVDSTLCGAVRIRRIHPHHQLAGGGGLGRGTDEDRPAVVDGAIVACKMMWLSLTFDHRLVDGAPAGRFLQYVKNLIQDPIRWLVVCLK